ncbi:MAG: DUF11 domain-containing protein [Sphingobacteriales bacterium]|nr:DUF11 domain-containing protein [Sphingobacteriales bacterium]
MTNFPTGLTFVYAEPTVGTYNPTTGIWTIGEIYAGEQERMYIYAIVTERGPIVNTAQIETVDQPDPDSTPGNDDPTEDDQDNEPVQAKQIDLELLKTADATAVNVGDEFTYTITLSNEGPDVATGVSVLDDLPTQVQYISATASQGAFNNNTSTWTVGTLEVGATVTLDITVKVLEGGSFENVAQVATANEQDIDSTPNNDNGDQSEDEEDAVVVEGKQIDLELQKTASAQEVGVGEQFTYTITLVNKGPSDATGVAVTDQLPAGVTFVSAAPNTYNAATGVWTIGNLAAGASTSLNITVTLNVEDIVINYAQVSAANEPDIDSEPGDNSDTQDDDDEVTVGGIAADLELDKDVDKNIVNLGDTVMFTILVENNGGANATGVTVSDQLPAGLTFVSYDATLGVYNDASGIWTIGEIYAGEFEVLHIFATVNSTANITNIAQIETVDQPDPDSTPGNDDPTEDDQDAETVGAKQIDLELTKTVDVTSGVLGDEFTYTITVTNEGPSDATGVVIGDNLPAEVIYITHGQTTGYYNPVSSFWTVGNLAVGTTQTLTITVRATEEAQGIKNIAQVVAANEPDIDSTPNNDNGDQSEDDEDAVIIDITPLGSIGDYVWLDEDGDGVQDAGEQGIPNVTVTLTYPDGTTATTTTDGTGHYIFEDLPAGNYVVTVGTGPDGTALTTPATDNVSLGAGEDYVDADFGFDGASLGNYVWLDENANGIQDSGEEGIDGVVVNLLDAAGNQIATTTTSNGGYYIFNVEPGQYIVEFVAPSGYEPTQQGGGDNQNNTDSNANTTTGQTAIITISAGENDMTIDAGYTPLGSIGDYVWLDVDGDGVQDAGEQGIPNVTVTLTYPDGTTATTTTDGTGHYIFEDLPAGNYVVTVGTGPDGTALTTPATDNVSLGAGEDYVDADFGFDGELIDLELAKTSNVTTAVIGDIITYTLTLS